MREMAIEASNEAAARRRIRLGMVGGGQGAFIGAVHRIAARIDDTNSSSLPVHSPRIRPAQGPRRTS